ncbi:LamG-like jellyroll fold domain-containing protein [Haliangium sp.]|uniref:LamG-like jellyroll fold domain-containing protein n=1 Tax=Haliangium sp. TaxID=2663208 RepID=UPI003D0C30FE
MATLTFRNKHFHPVNVLWLKDTEEVLQAVLEPGDSYRQASDDGHRWSVRDRTTGRVLKTLIATRDVEVDIKAHALRVPVADSEFEHIDVSHRHEAARRQNFALNFDGVDDLVSVPHSASLDLRDHWTIEAWVFRECKDLEQSVVEKFEGQDGGGGYALRIGADNRVHGGFYDGADFIFARSKTVLEGQRWYHLAATFNAQSGDIVIYINGESDGHELDVSRDLSGSRCVLEFDGNNDYLAVDGYDVSETAYTLSLWFRCEEPGRGIFSVDAGVRGAGGHDRDLYLDQSGNLCAYLEGGETIQSSGTNFGDGEWHHVSHVFGGSVGGQRLYVDGALVALGSRASSTFSGQNGVNIGYSSQAGQPFFKGQLAEVSLWNVARDARDLLDKWRVRLSGDEPGLQSLWRLDDGHGVSYRDAGPAGRPATVEDSEVTARMASMVFAGSSHAAATGISLHEQGFTFSCWFKRSGLGNDDQLAGLGTGMAVGFDAQDHVVFALQSYTLATQASYADTDWHHLALTFDASTLAIRIYCDGAEAAAGTAPQGYTGTGAFTLGKGTGAYFHGQLGEVMLWDSARDLDQINQDRSGTTIGTERGLLAYWYRALDSDGSDNGQTNGVYEGSKNHHHAIYDGAVSWQDQVHPGAQPARAPRWNRFSALRLVPSALTARGSTTALTIGARGDDGSTPMRGKIDAIRVWNLTRTAAEIRSHWNQALAGDEAGLQGYWRCDEGNDVTVYDSTANGNDGALGAGQPARMPSWYASTLMLMDGLHFDGEDDYIALPTMNPAFSKGLTIEAWVCLDSHKGFGSIVDLGNGNTGDNIVLWTQGSSNGLVLFVYRGTITHYLIATDVLEVGVWTHVAATLDAEGKATLYKNGAPVATGPVHLPVELERSQNYIGRSSLCDPSLIHGRVDEVRLWEGARTENQLRGYMRRELEPIAPGLVARYAFDEGSGLAAYDQSPNSLHGLLGRGNQSQAPTWQRAWERDDTGLSFDGTDDYVSVPDSAINDLAAGTIEAWVNLSASATGTICAKQHDGVGAYAVLSIGYACSASGGFEPGTPGKVYFHGRNGVAPAQSNTALTPNVWHHVAVTFDHSRASIYIDGRLDATAFGDFSIPDAPSVTKTSLGAWLGQGGGQYLGGILDEIRVWSVVRSAVQLQANMHRRINPTVVGLAAYWPVEVGTGAVLHDKTALLHHGTFGDGEAARMPHWLQASPIQFEGLEFDGCGSYVAIPNADPINLSSDFTLSAWIKPDKFRGVHTIISKVSDSKDCQYALSLDGEMLRFDYENEGNNFALVGGQLAEGWNHVAVTVERNLVEVPTLRLDAAGNPVTNTTSVHDLVEDAISVDEPTATEYQLDNITIDQPKVTLYVNGLEVSTGTAPLATDPSDASVSIGAWCAQINERFFCGHIDSVVIRNLALTQAELQQAMHQRLPSDAPGVCGYWRLSEDIGAGVVADASGNQNHGQYKRHRLHDYEAPQTVVQGTIELASDDAVLTLDRSVQITVGAGSPTPEAGKWTIELWLKFPLPQTPSGYNVLFSNEAGNIAFYHRDDGTNHRWGFLQDGAPSEFITYGARPTAGWHHLAIHLHEDSYSYIILDGEPSGNYWYAIKSATQYSDVSIRHIGNLPSGGARIGAIDELRLWSFERKPVTIRADFRKALQGTESGLFGYWRFEESDPTYARDRTPYQNHCTLRGDVQRIQDSSLQLALTQLETDLDVDGYDCSVAAPSLPVRPMWYDNHSEDDGYCLTISMFVQPPDDVGQGGDSRQVWWAWNNGHNDYKLEITADGRLRAALLLNQSDSSRTTYIEAITSTPLVAGRWHYVACVVDMDHLRVYVDGREEAVVAKVFQDRFHSTMNLIVSGGGGKVAEVCVWGKALTADEVTHYHEYAPTGAEERLYGYFDFSEQGGSQTRNLAAYREGEPSPGSQYIGYVDTQGQGWVEHTGLTIKRPQTCLHLNGVNQYVQLPSAAALEMTNEDFTVEVWIKPEQTSGSRMVVGCPANGEQPALLLGLLSGRPFMGFWDSGTSLLSDTALATGQWHHLAFRYSASARIMAILVNGAVDKFAYDCPPFTGTAALTLGGGGIDYSFAGYMSDLAVWDHARTSEEIRADAGRKYTGIESGLVGYWRLDGLTETYAADSSVQRNHGGLYGGARWVVRDELELDASKLVQMPPRASIEAMNWFAQQPTPDGPESRAQATNVVPAPTRVPRVETLTFTSTDAQGAIINAPTAQDPEETATFSLLSIEANTDFLPEPFKSLADRIIAAINDVTEVPKGDLLLTSAVLGPFDPFAYFFGTPAELLHIKGAYIQVVGALDIGTQSSTGTIGLRLGGEVSLLGLPPVRVECDFYKKGERPHFPSRDGESTNTSDGDSDSDGDGDGGIAYTLKFHLPEPIGVGTFLKDIPLLGGILFYKPSPEYVQDEDKRLLALVITNESDDEIDMKPGLNAFGTLRVASSDDPVFQFIGKLLGIDEIQLHVAAAPQRFNFDAVVRRNIEIIHDTVWFKDTGINIQVNTIPPEMSVKLKNSLGVKICGEMLTFTGAMNVSVSGSDVACGGSLSMEGDLHLFGIPGLVISDVAAEVAIGARPPWLNKIGVTGGLAIGKATAKMAVLFDLDSPNNSVIVGDVANVKITDIVDTLCGPGTVPGPAAEVLNKFHLRRLKISIVPTACTIGEISFDEEGITVKVGVTIYDWTGDLYLRLDYTDGITAYATVDPLYIANIFELRESRTLTGEIRTRLFVCPSTCPERRNVNIRAKGGECQELIEDRKCGRSLAQKVGPQMYLRLSPYDIPELYVSGYARFLGIELDTFVHLSSAGFYVDIKGKIWNLFEAKLQLEASWTRGYLYVKGEFRNDFFAHIRAEAVKAIHFLADKATDALDDAQASVRAAQTKVEGLRADIDRMQAQVKREREAMSRRLHDAQHKIDGAQREVNKLRHEMDRTVRWYNSLPNIAWFNEASKVRDAIPFAAKMAGLGIAYGIATAALQTAKLLLRGIDWVVINTPIDADPRIVALWAGYGIATGTLKATETALEGSKHFVRGAAFVVEQMARLALGELFDIRYAMFEGEFGGDRDAKRIHVKAHIVFLKMDLHVDFELDFNKLLNPSANPDGIDPGVRSLVTRLIDEHAA